MLSTLQQTCLLCHPYGIPLEVKQKVREELDVLLEAGIITKSMNLWAFPIVPIRQFCVDFWKLNATTTQDPFYMPLIEEILEQLGEASVFSKIDLAKCFYQIFIKLQDRPKAAFLIPFRK